MQHVPAAGNGLSRAPRLDTPVRDSAARRDICQLLIDIFHVKKPLHAVSDAFTKERVVFALDDKDKIAEPRASCVVHRKVNDAVPLLVNGLHLLEPAEAAAHSSGHNDKFRCLILHVKCLLQVTASIVSVPTEDCKPFSQEILLPTRMACERRAFVVHYVKSRLNPNMKRGE